MKSQDSTLRQKNSTRFFKDLITEAAAERILGVEDMI